MLGERVRWVGEREILVVVTQCLLLLTRMHHSYTTHTVSESARRRCGVYIGDSPDKVKQNLVHVLCRLLR